MYKRERGLSLIEAAMVLALATIFISGVLYYYQIAKENENRDEIMSTTMNIVATVNKLYANYGFHKSYTGLSNELIQKAIPSLKLNDNGMIIQPNGITIDVWPWQQNGGYVYVISIDHIPTSQCENYSTMLTSVGGNLIKKAWIGGSHQDWYPFNGNPEEVRKQLFAACHGITQDTTLISVALNT